jgi:hypothetical protein
LLPSVPVGGRHDVVVVNVSEYPWHCHHLVTYLPAARAHANARGVKFHLLVLIHENEFDVGVVLLWLYFMVVVPAGRITHAQDSTHPAGMIGFVLHSPTFPVIDCIICPCANVVLLSVTNTDVCVARFFFFFSDVRRPFYFTRTY